MELISQHTKRIMEGCKERARRAGLRFDDESLEYIVTNRDMIELGPKVMIPTLYDYWVHDVEVLRERGKYELYPSNPYETVINTRPAISFYNDNNPDWLNVMIFYHVLGHIDFFQNNHFFRHTWDDDFAGRALADKRLIARLRSEHGRWVDYVIEFARGIDNLVDYHAALEHPEGRLPEPISRLDFYFDHFLQKQKKVRVPDYVKEIERYNACLKRFDEAADECFFAEVLNRYPEFEALYDKARQQPQRKRLDVMQFILAHSKFLSLEENAWMKSVMEVVRKTSLYFQPQIRTKFMNEGWASYWHEKLFLEDERIRGHEVEFARVHSRVTALQRVGLNPYAIGLRLFQHIEEGADLGRDTLPYKQLADSAARSRFDVGAKKGQQTLFALREDLADNLFIQRFVDQDFVDRHRLFVVGRRVNPQRRTWEYFVQSRRAEDYRQMLLDSLYHPPRIEVDVERSARGPLYLVHRFEGKPLVNEFIANTLLGIEYLWGGAVCLETSVVEAPPTREGNAVRPVRWRRKRYTMAKRVLTSESL